MKKSFSLYEKNLFIILILCKTKYLVVYLINTIIYSHLINKAPRERITYKRKMYLCGKDINTTNYVNYQKSNYSRL